MTDEEWTQHFVRSLGLLLSGEALDVVDEKGRPIEDSTFLLLFNAHHAPMSFVLPGRRDAGWEIVLDTAHEDGESSPEHRNFQGSSTLTLCERSVCLLKLSGGTASDGMSLLR